MIKKTYVTFVLAFLVACAFSWKRNETNAQGGTIVAPEITLVGVNGKTVSLSKLKGKMVLVDFWASWCGPCRKENPNVVEAYEKYKDAKFSNAKGFEVYSVSLDRNEEAWKKAIKDDKLIWKYHGWDKEGIASKAYQVSSIPSGFLIDGKGNIIARGQELRGMGLHLALDRYLKK